MDEVSTAPWMRYRRQKTARREEKKERGMRMEKVQGIVHAYTPEKRYDMVRDLGIDLSLIHI